ncbi:major facilitator superfamily domain-containing protein [Lanmaoa asiatica]|nr:major facilitator superfamily domain-containing protein [Lanmaoa asiatica]
MLPPTSVSPAETMFDGLPTLTQKLVLLLMFCLAQFSDSFNNSELCPAIHILEGSMGITQGQSAWIMSAFQLTFALLLLISGRISDVYNPKNVFVVGVAFLGVLSVATGFVNTKIVTIVLRALMGIVSAMTIPSTLTLLVHVFPEPLEQAQLQMHRVFSFVTIVAIPVAPDCLFIITPEAAKSKVKHNTQCKMEES